MENQYDNFITILSKNDHTTHQDHHSIYVSIISMIIGLLSLIASSWIAWKYTNYRNRRQIIIDKINSNLIIINSTIEKFNRWAILNKSSNVILYEIATIEKQFPKLYNFLISLADDGNVLNDVSENVNISYLNLNLILKFFENFQDKLSHLIHSIFKSINNDCEYIHGDFFDDQKEISKIKKEMNKFMHVTFYLLDFEIKTEYEFIKLFSFNIYFAKENKLSIKLFGFRFIKEHKKAIKKNKEEFYLTFSQNRTKNEQPIAITL